MSPEETLPWREEDKQYALSLGLNFEEVGVGESEGLLSLWKGEHRVQMGLSLPLGPGDLGISEFGRASTSSSLSLPSPHVTGGKAEISVQIRWRPPASLAAVRREVCENAHVSHFYEAPSSWRHGHSPTHPLHFIVC